jgi:peptide/nickel transport system permease protein
MGRFLVRQAIQLVLVLVLVSGLVFFLTHLTGDPTHNLLPPDATYEDIARLRERLGLDQPVVVQYVRWVQSVLSGDFGNSVLVGRRPAVELIAERFPMTLLLAATGLTLAILVAVPLGILAALRRGSVVDTSVNTFVLAGQAMPSFWFGIILIIIISVQFRWLPPSGFRDWQSLILPTITLAISQMPPIMRLVRSGMIETLSQDYVRTARAKGLPEHRVIWRHVFRNAAIPVVTVIAIRAADLLGGAVIVEVVFAWPGLGTLLASSISNADFPVIQAGVLMIALVVVVMNIVGDVALALLDPRIRLS